MLIFSIPEPWMCMWLFCPGICLKGFFASILSVDGPRAEIEGHVKCHLKCHFQIPCQKSREKSRFSTCELLIQVALSFARLSGQYCNLDFEESRISAFILDPAG
jgi:hypothetical protein